MKLIIIFGPPAVGKMTVGYELKKITALKLFHNHMTIDLAAKFFDFEAPNFSHLVETLRIEILKEIAKSDLKGVIFTCGWVLNDEPSTKFINKIARIFQKKRGEIFYVELEADLKTRLKRNKSAFRLKHKPSKRDIKTSEARLLAFEKNCRFNTRDGELKTKKYLKIENSSLSAQAVAKIIKEKFKL